MRKGGGVGGMLTAQTLGWLILKKKIVVNAIRVSTRG